jgi:hypothetical protein
LAEIRGRLALGGGGDDALAGIRRRLALGSAGAP